MRIKIHKTDLGIPTTVRHSFVFNTRSYGMHRAEVILSIDGEYKITVDGSSYSIHEAAAKRSAQYKTAILRVSDEMRQAIDSYNEAFVYLARNTVRPKSRSVLESQLGALVLKHYNREAFNLPEPKRSSVESDLREEAEAKFFSVWKGNSSKKDQFVADNAENIYQQRLANWEELKRYHESIQDYFEAQTNQLYQQEYDEKKKAIEDELNGDMAYIKKQLNELNSKGAIKIPFDLTLEVDYDKPGGIIDATASLPSLIYIPNLKTSLFASGKIGIKEKLKREMEADTSNTLLGLSYYLAGHLFSLSINVNVVRLTVITGFDAYYWVEYDRKSFSSLFFSNLYPLQDFFRHPNVIDYKKNAIELIPEDEMKQRVTDAIKISDALTGNNDLVALPIKEAEMICKTVVDSDDLRCAVKEAKASKSTIVVVNKRYLNILREINGSNSNC